MICPAKVRRSTIAAHRRGSVKVLVQPEKGSLEAIAIAERSSRSVRTWNRSSAPRRSSAMAQLVQADQIDTAVPGDELRQLPFVGGLDQLVDQLGREGVADPVAGLGGQGAQRDQQVGLSGADSDSDRLQHLRSVLPCEVRVTAAVHPLFGCVLAAQQFRRVEGVLFLVVGLPDGSPGTVRADATNVLSLSRLAAPGVVLDGDGVRTLRDLVGRLSDTSTSAGRQRRRQIGSTQP
jgi:hypothetical protein